MRSESAEAARFRLFVRGRLSKEDALAVEREFDPAIRAAQAEALEAGADAADEHKRNYPTDAEAMRVCCAIIATTLRSKARAIMEGGK